MARSVNSEAKQRRQASISPASPRTLRKLSCWPAKLASGRSSAVAELRISDLDVFLNDYEVTVHVVLLGALPEGLHEGVQSGIPAHVRFTVELWQYRPYWPDHLLMTKVIERSLAYNVVTKEFKVSALHGEAGSVFATRDLRDAQRILSELRLKLTPAK